MSDIKYEEPKASKLPIAALTTRVTILVTLAISMGLLRSDSVNYKVDTYPGTFNYDNMVTYRYEPSLFWASKNTGILGTDSF